MNQNNITRYQVKAVVFDIQAECRILKKELSDAGIVVIVPFFGVRAAQILQTMLDDTNIVHKVYGKIEASLNIFSHLGIERFIEGVRSGKSTELMNITGGYHYHTVRAENEETLDAIEEALSSKGYIVPEI